ncbi:O-antigen ligase family protein [uncultured Desulfuromusa sp.]|uniref:O-antigen ligase family protein n=1 Tax=uncultured Desulfuromusa sp. TaxID=219183 RepID=UPI002AA63571|nr:O-antigen ligase family protein [uncultured Desulfuromusa sp.]
MKKLSNNYPEVNLSITLLFNFYVFIWWLEIGKRVTVFETIRIEFVIGLVLSVIGLYQYLSKPKKNLNHDKDLVGSIFIFIIILFLSLPLAADFDVAWDAFFNKIIKYSLMCFFITQFVVSPKTLRYFSLASFLAFFKVGQEAMFGKITGSMVWQNQGIPRLHGAPGTMFGHPNSLSGKTLSFLPFLWFLWPLINSKWIKILIFIQIIFTLNIILYTGSRTGYLTFIMFLLILFYISKNKGKMAALIIIFGLVSFSFIPTHYKERFASSFSGHEAAGRSKEARKQLFLDSLTVFVENPLGVGGYCFPVVQRKNDRRAQETHNLYTQLLAETGIQGFIAFMYLIFTLIKKINELRIGFRQNIDKFLLCKGANIEKSFSDLVSEELKISRLGLAMADALYTVLLVRLVLGIFGHDLFEIYWWIICGVTVSLTSIICISNKRISELTIP